MNQYVSSMLKSMCYSELHDLFVRSNKPAKEISESYAAFHHLKSVMGEEMQKDHLFLHIGDGKYCRTAALFTLMLGIKSTSKNMSIDPNINAEFMKEWGEGPKWGETKRIKNFTYLPHKWQDVDWNEKTPRQPYSYVLVHAHVNLREMIDKIGFNGWSYIYSNPCCNISNQILSLTYCERHHIDILKCGADHNIISPKNMVFVYRNNLILERW